MSEYRSHDLKTDPEPFGAVVVGAKRFEYRRNDRDFRVGDYLQLREYDRDLGLYSGQAFWVVVLYMLEGPAYGIPEGYCIMSILRLNKKPHPYRERAQGGANE